MKSAVGANRFLSDNFQSLLQKSARDATLAKVGAVHSMRTCNASFFAGVKAFMKRKAVDRDRVVRLGWWLFATIVFLLVVAIRIRLLGIPLERDEGEYAYAGQLMLEGIPPYELACNMKFPGT